MLVSRRMLDETKTTVMDTDGFVNYPRGIDTVEMAIFFREMDSGKVNVSLRSRGRLNVAEFARSHQGGGHHNAAAFRAEGSFKEVVDEVIAAAEEFIAGGSQ
jgi:phosphoesterase RecJ-like protein